MRREPERRRQPRRDAAPSLGVLWPLHLTLNVAETSKMLTDTGFTRWVALGDGSMCVKNMDVLDVEERGEKERGKL